MKITHTHTYTRPFKIYLRINQRLIKTLVVFFVRLDIIVH